MTDQEELRDLIDALDNRVIDADGMRRLEALLLEDSAARAYFRRAMNLHAALHERADGGAEFDTVLPVVSRKWGAFRFLTPFATAAAAAAIAVLATLFLIGGDRTVESLPEDLAGELSMPRASAVLTSAVGVQWASGSQSPRVGGSFIGGDVELVSGLLNIDFLCGANVVLEGPARLEILSAEYAVLHHGKLRATVPPHARGFTIDTAAAKFVDLGTEFGIDCSSGGNAELHVFDGEVEVHDLAGENEQQLVRSGAGLRVGREGAWNGIESDDTGFVDAFSLNRMAEAGTTDSFARWQSEHRRVVDHPAIVAYYDFEPTDHGTRTLADLSPSGRDGAVVGCSWSEGRWPGKGALEFKQSSDRVRIDIPGQFRSLTMTVWLRIDGFDRQFNSILLTDSFTTGNAHWQIKSNGAVDLGVMPPSGRRELYLTQPRLLGMADLGRWIQLAMVYDADAKQVNHYLDGQSIKSIPISEDQDFPLVLGPSLIGNWDPETPAAAPIRNLNGRIDELAIFSAALPPEEIRAQFELGRPF